MIVDPESALDQIGFIFERIEEWSAIFTEENVLAFKDEVVDYTDLTRRTVVRI